MATYKDHVQGELFPWESKVHSISKVRYSRGLSRGIYNIYITYTIDPIFELSPTSTTFFSFDQFDRLIPIFFPSRRLSFIDQETLICWTWNDFNWQEALPSASPIPGDFEFQQVRGNFFSVRRGCDCGCGYV